MLHSNNVEAGADLRHQNHPGFSCDCGRAAHVVPFLLVGFFLGVPAGGHRVGLLFRLRLLERQGVERTSSCRNAHSTLRDPWSRRLCIRTTRDLSEPAFRSPYTMFLLL